MHFEDPLAYVLGIQGTALMRAYSSGGYGRDFVDARIAEIRRLLDATELQDRGVEVEWVDPIDGYRIWSPTYDNPDNGLLQADLSFVNDAAAMVEPGVALDAACGTGRLAEHLATYHHRVIGIDNSPDMLTLAKQKVPDGEFRVGDLDDLPVGDNEVDVVTCALALVHIDDVVPVFAEFARVLRRGGQLVVTDVHPELVAWGSVPPVVDEQGRRGRVRTYRHRTGDYLRAALDAGFDVRKFAEDSAVSSDGEHEPLSMPDDLEVGPWEAWPWSLAELVPEAGRVVAAGMPGVIMWHFQVC